MERQKYFSELVPTQRKYTDHDTKRVYTLYTHPSTHNYEEQRTKLTFAQLHKKFKRGIVYLEQCETIPQKGFMYEGKNYRRVLIGTLGRKLTFEDYVNTNQSIKKYTNRTK